MFENNSSQYGQVRSNQFLSSKIRAHFDNENSKHQKMNKQNENPLQTPFNNGSQEERKTSPVKFTFNHKDKNFLTMTESKNLFNDKPSFNANFQNPFEKKVQSQPLQQQQQQQMKSSFPNIFPLNNTFNNFNLPNITNVQNNVKKDFDPNRHTPFYTNKDKPRLTINDSRVQAEEMSKRKPNNYYQMGGNQQQMVYNNGSQAYFVPINQGFFIQQNQVQQMMPMQIGMNYYSGNTNQMGDNINTNMNQMGFQGNFIQPLNVQIHSINNQIQLMPQNISYCNNIPSYNQNFPISQMTQNCGYITESENEVERFEEEEPVPEWMLDYERNHLLVPKEKKNDEKYKLLKMKGLRKLGTGASKSAKKTDLAVKQDNSDQGKQFLLMFRNMYI
jgi:hypothetical protein